MSLSDLNSCAALWAPAILRACWQGALGVALVWAICRTVPRLPSSLRAGLWWLACLKTVAGLFFTAPLAVAVLPAAPMATPMLAPDSAFLTKVTADRTDLRDPGMLPVLPERPAKPMVTAAAAHPVTSTPPTVSPTGLVFCLWLAGVSFYTALAVLHLRRVRRLTRQAVPFADTQSVRDVAQALGLCRPPTVRVSDQGEGSLVIGPWRPIVLLCCRDLDGLSEEERRGLLAHELAHVRRRDLWAGVVPNLARLLFFFHPLVWLACREYDLARESACDADALRVSRLGPAAYGRLLLKLSSEPVSRPRHAAIALGAASPYHHLRRRLQGIACGASDLPPWRLLVTFAGVAGVLSLAPVRATSPMPTLKAQERPSAAIPAGAGAGSEQIIKATAAVPLPPVSHRRSIPLLAAPIAARAPQLAQVTTMVVPAAPVFPPAAKLSPVSLQDNRGVLAEPSVISSGISSDPNKTKEVSPMSNPSNPSKPQFSSRPKRTTAFALVAATPAFLAAAAAFSQDSVPPVPAPPPVTAAPAAPAPPASSEPARTSRYQYTLRQGNSFMVRTNDKSIGEAQRALARAQPGDSLVVDRDGRRYLITDAGVLRRIQENDAPLRAIGGQMEAVGKQMEGIGKPMEALGKEMEALGKQMEERAAKFEAAAEGGNAQASQRAFQEDMEKLQKQMRALGDRMRDEGRKMSPLSDQMKEHGKRMGNAAKEAEARMTGIIDAAFQNNLAIEQTK